MLASLNAYRASCGGTAMPATAGNSALATAATKHAGWQARYDVLFPAGAPSLSHNEGSSAQNNNASNAFWVADAFDDRIRAANGGSNLITSGFYYEIIASQSGSAAVDQLWDSVYHRIAMDRPPATLAGYGDMALAALLIPTGGLPATSPWGNPDGNGYGTIEYAAPSLAWTTASWWPATGASGVPRSFVHTSESPDPLPAVGASTVGVPLHAIFPTALPFTGLTVTLSGPGGTVACYAVVPGTGATTPTGSPPSPAVTTAPTAGSGQVAQGDIIMDVQGDLVTGEVFIMPKAALASSSTYTWSVQATDSSATTYSVPASSFTTGTH